MARNIGDNDIDRMAQDTGKELAAQPKMKVKLFLAPEERKSLEAKVEQGQSVQWPAEQVWVNGYCYTIQKGKDVEVPETVAHILSEAGLI